NTPRPTSATLCAASYASVPFADSKIERHPLLIEAHVATGADQPRIQVATNGATRSLAIPPKPNAQGLSTNGGELLCLALATCYCNDIYREAETRNITVKRVEVHAQAEFGAIGEAAKRLVYRAAVEAVASEAQILDLMLHTDRVAEIQNTLRKGID